MRTDFDFISFFADKLQCKLIKVEKVGGGRNSQVFRMEDSKGKKFAAKIYFSHKIDPRDRLGTEFNALGFLWKNSIKNIPEPIFADSKKKIAVYDYVDGASPLLSKFSLYDIDSACEFLIKLNQLRNHADAKKLPNASEAVFSINELFGNIEQRYERIMALTEKNEEVLECQNFINNQLYPFFTYLVNGTQSKLISADMSLDTILPKEEQTLSPSDFGFHNAIRQPDGAMVFLDFEYFGWDDPAKMIADFVLHPGMNLEFELKERFIDKMLGAFGDKGSKLRDRFSMFLPLLGVKWCFILLNEFIPADMARRDFSGNTADNPNKIKIKQLNKAKKMLKEVTINYEQHNNFS